MYNWNLYIHSLKQLCVHKAKLINGCVDNVVSVCGSEYVRNQLVQYNVC